MELGGVLPVYLTLDTHIEDEDPMPSYTPDLAMRSHLDSQISTLAELTRKSVDTARRLNELHLELTRDLCEDYFNLSRQLVAANDPAQMSALMSRQLEPLSTRLRNYTQQLGSILGGVQLDLTRATESFMPHASRAAQLFAASAMPGAATGAGLRSQGRGNGAA